MEKIIAEILKKYVRKCTEIFVSEAVSGMDGKMRQLREMSDSLTAELFEEMTRQLDRKLYEDKKHRKEEGLLVQAKHQEKNVMTVIGPVRLERTVYRRKDSGEYVRPMDMYLGLEKHQRTSLEVMTGLVTEAARESYSRSSRHVTKGALSRQTVYHTIRKMRLPAAEICREEEKRSVQVLHIYADEDHAHMQKPHKSKGKRNQSIPLVTVTEGIVAGGKGRMETVNAVSFVDEEFRTERLWDTVEGYLNAAYDLGGTEKIYLYGDGANWIRNGLSDMTQVHHVMDGFHWEKRLRGAIRLSGCKNLRQMLKNRIMKNDRNGAEELLTQLYDGLEEARREGFLTFCSFVLNQWDAIRNYYTEKDLTGSCTEALVSHYLSERFSRDPMGWSRESLGKLSCARIHILNGNEITSACFRKEEAQGHTYSAYLEELKEAWLKEANDWSIFEPVKETADQNSGIQTLLHQYGQVQMEYIH